MKSLAPNQRAKLQRKCLTEIVRGYSTLEWSRSVLFIKHLNHFDIENTEEYYEEQFEKAKNKGLPTEKERLVELDQLEIWGKKDEDRIKYLDSYLDGLKKNKKKLLPIKEQLEWNRIETEKTEKELNELIYHRAELLRATCESYASKQQNNYYLMYSLYKDKSFNELFFKTEEFDDLETSELNLLFLLSNQKLELFCDNNIKWLAIAQFFQNLFGLTEQVYHFYGKPIVNLTFYQINLSIYGINYKNMLNNSEKIPDHVKDDPVEFEEWFTLNQNAKEVQSKNPGANLVGADSKYYSQESEGENVLDLDAFMKSGATSRQDLLEVLK